MNDFLKIILNTVKDFVVNNTKILLYVFISLISISIIFQYFSTCNHNENQVVSKEIVNANYKNDMNFLECIAEQHSCIYKNLDNLVDHNLIKEVCKNENYCSNLGATNK